MADKINLGKHTVDATDLSGSFLLFVMLEPEDCKADYFLVPFEIDFELCNILASINGLIVNNNQDEFDSHLVDWFCEFNAEFYEYSKSSDNASNDVSIFNEDYPLFKYHVEDPYVHHSTISFISTVAFAP